MVRFITASGFRLFLFGFGIGLAAVTGVATYQSHTNAQMAINAPVRGDAAKALSL